VASVGTAGDSYDNALAESTIGQLKAELIHRRGLWRTVEQLEFAVFECLEVFHNRRRRHSSLGMLTPIEYETLQANATA
jgi:transposase InsO family protein